MLKRDDELFSLGFCINLLSNMHNNYQENVFTNVWNSFLNVTYGKKASLEQLAVEPFETKNKAKTNESKTYENQ